MLPGVFLEYFKLAKLAMIIVHFLCIFFKCLDLLIRFLYSFELLQILVYLLVY